jgi:formylglycine-generating enzyme required for sulfatase activity
VVSDTPRFGERLLVATRLPDETWLPVEVQPPVVAVAFRQVAAGMLTQSAALPHEVALQPFSIAESPVSNVVWEQFLAACPEWQGDNLVALLEDKLVSEDYLLTLDNAPAGVVSVSWHAANAFCAWLTTQLPATQAAYEVRLPTEAEWEYAAKGASGATPDNGADGGVRSSLMSGAAPNMQSDLWEWCADPYAPCNFLPAPADVIEAIASPERVVRGGLWVNQPDTRASLPPDFCSPFVSFRPVLAVK